MIDTSALIKPPFAGFGSLPGVDLLIAATPHRHGLALATRNADDFRRLERVLHVVAVT